MTRKAVVVGIKSYPKPTPVLEAAVIEAERWVQLLRSMYGFLDANIDLREDTGATRPAVEQALRDLLTGASADDELVFIFCGHGCRVDLGSSGKHHIEEALFLYPTGTDREDATLTGTRIGQIISESKPTDASRLTIIVDCCFAAALSIPERAKQQYVELLDLPLDGDRGRLVRFEDFTTGIDRKLSSGKPIIVAACQADKPAFQIPGSGTEPARFLFSKRALPELTALPNDTYEELMSHITPLDPKYKQEPRLAGNLQRAKARFLSGTVSAAAAASTPHPQPVPSSASGVSMPVRILTVRIAGTCCFVDPAGQQPFKKRLVLPYDNLASTPEERHIPFIEFPDAHIEPGSEKYLSDTYVHEERVLGSPEPILLEVQYRRFELLGHTITIAGVDMTQALTTTNSFDNHVPSMTLVAPFLYNTPRFECFDTWPNAGLISGFFDMSAGILNAGELYEFVTYFTDSAAYYQTPKYVELLLPLTTSNVTVTIAKGNSSFDVVLDEGTDVITIGNEPEADILGSGSGEDVASHFLLYYNLAGQPVGPNPPRPIQPQDPVNSCSVVTWP